MDMEMQAIRSNGNDGAAHCNELVTAGNGAGAACRYPDATENHGLLSELPTRSNGETVPSDHATKPQRTLGNAFTREITSVCRKSRVKLWWIGVFLLVFICAVIVVSLAVCSAIHEDADENFDRSLFKVPRSFNGSFRLPNQTFTEELFTLSSNESQALTAELQEKLADLYRSSPALGRYFSGAEIHAFRNGSVIADYQLMFLMPEEQQDQLGNITLSREMVFNVFRQFLNDQEADESGQMLLVQIKTSRGIMGAYNSNLDDIMEEDMHHWYTKFMKESPSGLITLFELKTMLEMTGMTEEASSYVDQVFFTFDMDGDGYMDFVEYIAAISLLLKGEVNQKLKWYFKLFDQDGNGKIDKDEMETIFKAIQDITRNYDVPPEDIVTLVYEKIDIHREGELTLEEFIAGARDHPDIMDMLTKMMDLTNVLEIIVMGQRKPAIN